MGIELYLQTVALRADAETDCNINSDTFAGADLGDTFSGATTSTGPATQTDSVNNAGFAQFIDLDHNGVADMCQLRGGDFDLNGMIDERDMSILLNMINTKPVLGIGDMDGNGEIDSADMSLILLQMN